MALGPKLQSVNPTPDSSNTIFSLIIQMDMSGQTVKTKIKLPLKEQFDQGLHYLSFSQYFI